jgi:UDP-2,3-diacylglucosamine pyrophosphatase LpxH
VIYCISDTHFGDKGPRDNFAARGSDRLLRFNDFVSQNKGRILILGDMFDWWQCNLGESLLQYKDELDALYPRSVWIPGNHDSDFTPLLAHPFLTCPHPLIQYGTRPFTETINGKAFAFLHGHEADPYCSSSNPGTGELTAIISGMLEDKHGQDTGQVEEGFVGGLERLLTLYRRLSGQHGRLDEMIDNVLLYREQKKADVIVSGHTHVPGRIGNHYYNTGCWCRDMDTFVQIEEDGSVQMFVWDGYKAMPFDKELR